jgi:hypothetical protein
LEMKMRKGLCCSSVVKFYDLQWNLFHSSQFFPLSPHWLNSYSGPGPRPSHRSRLEISQTDRHTHTHTHTHSDYFWPFMGSSKEPLLITLRRDRPPCPRGIRTSIPATERTFKSVLNKD